MTISQAQVRARLDSLAKPPGSLGRLEDLAVLLALTQQRQDPLTTPRRLVLFAGDHGVVAQGVTPWPSAVTTAMVRTILSGKATSTVFARLHGVDVRVVDCGIAEPVEEIRAAHYRAAPVARGTQDLSQGPAMSATQFDKAWAIGADEARRAIGDGCRLLIAGEMGIGNTTPSACLVHLLTMADADSATGYGAGADDAMRARKRDVVAAAVARLGGAKDKAALAAISGFEIVAMAGFLAEGASGGASLLIDGYVVTAAALIAEHLAPGSRHAMIAAHRSAEPGHGAALAQLGLEPLLEWDMRLGEGTGALTALPLLDAAAALLGEVATLAEVLGA
ncbi:MAG: nicotinate-nucleotide--dimethylbenzimidazole phosphoribosyltransferase [Novosphingobium sp.]